jgi:hypothetical protein
MHNYEKKSRIIFFVRQILLNFDNISTMYNFWVEKYCNDVRWLCIQFCIFLFPFVWLKNKTYWKCNNACLADQITTFLFPLKLGNDFYKNCKLYTVNKSMYFKSLYLYSYFKLVICFIALYIAWLNGNFYISNQSCICMYI